MYLAPLEVELIRVLTAASSHMTAVLQLMNWAEQEHVKPPDLGPEFDVKPLLENGFLSKQRVLSCCPGMAPFLDQGIEYITVRHQIVTRVPRLMAVLSLADNAGHDVYRKETWMQQLLSMHSRAMTVDAKNDEDWDAVCKAMLRGEHEFPIEVGAVVKFVRHFSGGSHAPFLNELDAWSKALNVKRMLAGSLFTDVSACSVFREHPMFGLAIIKSSMACSQKYVLHGKAHLWSGADFASIAKRAPEVAIVAIMQQRARTYLQELGVDRASYELLLGTFDMRLVEFVGKKKTRQAGRNTRSSRTSARTSWRTCGARTVR